MLEGLQKTVAARLAVGRRQGAVPQVGLQAARVARVARVDRAPLDTPVAGAMGLAVVRVVASFRLGVCERLLALGGGLGETAAPRCRD